MRSPPYSTLVWPRKGPFCNKMAGSKRCSRPPISMPSRLARSLLRRSRQGALATLMAGQRRSLLLAGQCRQPSRRLADPADFAAGAAYQEHPRRSPGLADAGRARRGRSAGGRADHAGGPGRGGLRATLAAILRRRYLNAHPSAEAFVDFKDFSFFRIAPSGAHLVAGFGRIVDLAAGAVPDRYQRCRGACWRPSRAPSST